MMKIHGKHMKMWPKVQSNCLRIITVRILWYKEMDIMKRKRRINIDFCCIV